MAGFKLQTFADLYNAVREEVKIQSGDTSTINRIKRDINIAYLNEVAPKARFWWLREQVTLQTNPAIFLGTASVTSNSNEVTLSQGLTPSKKRYYFTTLEFEEIYEIKEHTPGEATFKLTRPYMGKTNSQVRYWIWSDEVPLPQDCRETSEVTHVFNSQAVQALGHDEFRKTQQLFKDFNATPSYYSTSNYRDPDPFTPITGLPGVTTAASDGLVKTVVFDSSLGASTATTSIQVGDRIRTSKFNHPSLNGDFQVSSVTTTTNAFDTVTFTGDQKSQLSPAAQTGTPSLELANQATSNERYRSLIIHPSLWPSKVQLDVTYYKRPPELVNDSDEPLLPVEDRAVILYGALHKAWARERNPEEAVRNAQLFEAKLKSMINNTEDSVEYPILEVSESYLRRKRRSNKYYRRR